MTVRAITALSAAAIMAVTTTAGAGMANAQFTAPGPKDVVFVIDTTASMRNDIDATKVATNQLASRLAAADGTSRVGLVEYRDVGDDFQSRTVIPLTSDFGRFRAGLNGLTVAGGGDDNESMYSGIARGLCQSWLPDRTNAIIVIGDAPPKDPEPVTGLTANAVVALANGTSTANPVCGGGGSSKTQVHVISTNPGVTDLLGPVAGGTGGRSVNAKDSGAVVQAIESTVNEIDRTKAIVGSIEAFATGLSGISSDESTTGSLNDPASSLESGSDRSSSEGGTGSLSGLSESGAITTESLAAGAAGALALAAVVGPSLAQFAPYLPR